MLIVCLSPSEQAHNPYWGNLGVESTHMRDIANRIAPILKASGFEVRLTDPSWASLPQLTCLSKIVNFSNGTDRTPPRKPADIHVAPHSNAGAAGADGTDTYYFAGSVKGRQLASAIQGPVAAVSPGTDGGIHSNSTFYELKHTVAVSALVEVAFHTDPEDTRSIVAHPDDYAMAIAGGICHYAGVKMVIPQAVNYLPFKREGVKLADVLKVDHSDVRADTNVLGEAFQLMVGEIFKVKK